MRFGQKISLSFFLIGVIPIIALALLFYNLNARFLLDNKIQHLWSSLASLESLLNQEKTSLDSTLQDYTIWSDHYQALLEGNESWIEENIISWVPEHFGMDLVVLWDRTGKKFASAGDLTSFNSDIQDLALKRALEDHQFFSGFELMGSSLALFSAGPVLPNEGKGAPAGALLFVRSLKPEDFSLFQSENSFPLLLVGKELQVPQDRASIPEIEELRKKVKGESAESFSLFLSNGAIFVSKAILNPQGKTLGYLGLLDLSREVVQAKQNTLIFSLIVAVGFLGLVLLASGFLRRWLLAPLNALSQDVQDLSGGKKVEKRKWPRDQIGELAGSFINLYQSSQEALQKAENEKVLFRGILDSSQDVILVFDSQGKFQDANLAAERFFSASKKELLDMTPEEALERLNIDPQTLSPRFWESLKEAFSSGKETVYEGFFEALKKEVIVSFLPLFLEKELKGVILSIKDVTALRKLELERRNLLEGVTHDLGSPITSLLAAVELLKRNCASPRELGYLNSMENNLILLKNLVQNLVNLNRLEAGAIRLEKVSLDLCPYLERIRTMFQPLIQSRRLSLAVNCPPGLPPLYADPVRLEEIFSNLISNSIKHTPPDGLILISAKNTGAQIKISFQDTGCGIPKEELNFVFQRFSQGERGRRAGGSGLGLYITKSLVELMGGTIALKSEEGKGTLVELSFPLNQPN